MTRPKGHPRRGACSGAAELRLGATETRRPEHIEQGIETGPAYWSSLSSPWLSSSSSSSNSSVQKRPIRAKRFSSSSISHLPFILTRHRRPVWASQAGTMPGGQTEKRRVQPEASRVRNGRRRGELRPSSHGPKRSPGRWRTSLFPSRSISNQARREFPVGPPCTRRSPCLSNSRSPGSGARSAPRPDGQGRWWAWSPR